MQASPLEITPVEDTPALAVLAVRGRLDTVGSRALAAAVWPYVSGRVTCTSTAKVWTSLLPSLQPARIASSDSDRSTAEAVGRPTNADKGEYANISGRPGGCGE